MEVVLLCIEDKFKALYLKEGIRAWKRLNG